MTSLPTEMPGDGPSRKDSTVLALVDDRSPLLSYIGHGGMGVVFRARDRLKGKLIRGRELSFETIQVHYG